MRKWIKDNWWFPFAVVLAVIGYIVTRGRQRGGVWGRVKREMAESNLRRIEEQYERDSRIRDRMESIEKEYSEILSSLDERAKEKIMEYSEDPDRLVEWLNRRERS